MKKTENYNRIKEIQNERHCSWSNAKYWFNVEIGKIKPNKKYKDLTKQDLIDAGITDVYTNGRIFTKYGEVTPSEGTYLTVYLKPKYFFVHRVVYVWFNGIQPAGMAVDHINENKWDNRLENLRLLTIGENAARTNKLGRNQHTKNSTDDEIMENRRTKIIQYNIKITNRIAKHRNKYLEFVAMCLEHIDKLQERADSFQKEGSITKQDIVLNINKWRNKLVEAEDTYKKIVNILEKKIINIDNWPN